MNVGGSVGIVSGQSSSGNIVGQGSVNVLRGVAVLDFLGLQVLEFCASVFLEVSSERDYCVLLFVCGDYYLLVVFVVLAVVGFCYLSFFVNRMTCGFFLSVLLVVALFSFCLSVSVKS